MQEEGDKLKAGAEFQSRHKQNNLMLCQVEQHTQSRIRKLVDSHALHI
jgi:hypothetical protein